MRLLVAEEIEDNIDSPDTRLFIENFSKEQLHPAAYYVRLGSDYYRMSDGLVDEPQFAAPNGYITLDPGEYIRIRTYEEFRLSSRTFGIFGNRSTSAQYGLDVVAGQFVDPLFPGYIDVTAPLEFGLKNMSESRAAIRVRESIAKICFFDISDSLPIPFDSESPSARHYQTKIPAAQTTLKRDADSE